MSQADSIRFRGLRVGSADAGVATGPTDASGVNPGSPPQFQMSPVSPSGMPTTGFTFMLKAPTLFPATAGGGGFSVTVWFRDPNSGRWGSSVTVSVAFSQLWICNDVDAMDGVFFQIANVAVAGDIDIHFAEQ